MAALFTIAIASSLIVVSGSFVGSAFAATKKKVNKQDDAYDMVTTLYLSGDKYSVNADDSSGDTGNTSGISAKDLKSLSNCQSDAAADGDLTQAEVSNCYRQTF